MRGVRAVLGVVMLAGVVFAAASAFGVNVPKGGAIQVWVNPALNGRGGGTVLVTGAVADYGTSEDANATGMADAKGAYKKLLLKHGTILVDATKLNAAGNNTNPSMYNKTDCSAVIDFSAPAQIVSGTGAYFGISGSVELTARFAFILPKTAQGTCNMANSAVPLDQYGTIAGAGTVTFVLTG